MKKIKLNTRPKVVYSSNMQVVDFSMYFPITSGYFNYYNVKLLDYMLINYTKKYPDRKEICRVFDDKLLIDKYMFSINNIGTSFIVYRFTMPKDKIIDGYSLEEAFALAISLLYEPYASSGSFNCDKFNYEKDYFVKCNESYIENRFNRLMEDFYSIIDKDLSLRASYSYDTSVLLGITPSSLYDFYIKNIVNNRALVYVYGDISEEVVINLFKKYTDYNEEDVEILVSSYKALEDRENINIVKDSPFKQSVIFLEYKLKDMLEDEVSYLKMFLGIISFSYVRLLYRLLREEKGIVYDTSVFGFTFFGRFIVYARISDSNKEEFINTCNYVFKYLMVKDNLKKCMDKYIEGLEVTKLDDEDSNSYLISKVIAEDMGLTSIDSYISKCKDVCYDKFIDVINRIELISCVYYKGVL